jgi:hypothetical protein
MRENNTNRMRALENESDMARERKYNTMSTSMSIRIKEPNMVVFVKTGNLDTYAAPRPVITRASVIQRYTLLMNVAIANSCDSDSS